MQKSRLGINQNLSVDGDEGHVTFFYKPDASRFEHHHIELTDDEAIQLQRWLTHYLMTKEVQSAWRRYEHV